jgi:hypothetical protein
VNGTGLALNGQCDQSLQQAEAAETLSQRPPSALMDSWLAWTHYACKREDLYQRSKQRIEAAIAKNPQRFDPGYFYLYAIEGDSERATKNSKATNTIEICYLASTFRQQSGL